MSLPRCRCIHQNRAANQLPALPGDCPARGFNNVDEPLTQILSVRIWSVSSCRSTQQCEHDAHAVTSYQPYLNEATKERKTGNYPTTGWELDNRGDTWSDSPASHDVVGPAGILQTSGSQCFSTCLSPTTHIFSLIMTLRPNLFHRNKNSIPLSIMKFL